MLMSGILFEHTAEAQQKKRSATKVVETPLNNIWIMALGDERCLNTVAGVEKKLVNEAEEDGRF